MDTPLDIKRYLQRIGYTGALNPTLEVLCALQRAQVRSVPFENLDIHHRVWIDFKHSFDKIVVRNRGGFCYELNFLFYQLLKAMGFTAKVVSARVFNPEKSYGPEYDHMAIIVTLDEEDYLVDVGFGEFAFHPIPLKAGKETHDPRGEFRVRTYDGQYWVVEKKNLAGEFIPEYIFTPTERQPEAFEAMCRYHQTSSLSHFTQKRVCTLPTDTGRVTLTGNTLKITDHGITTEEEIKTEREAEEILWNYFKIKTAQTEDTPASVN